MKQAEKVLPLRFLRDSISDPASLTYGELNYSIMLHPGVCDDVERKGPALQKRLGLVLQQLAAHGMRGNFKPCCENRNRGWFRAPLGGGSNGMQHYLWWTKKGNQPVKDFDLPYNTIISPHWFPCHNYFASPWRLAQYYQTRRMLLPVEWKIGSN